MRPCRCIPIQEVSLNARSSTTLFYLMSSGTNSVDVFAHRLLLYQTWKSTYPITHNGCQKHWHHIFTPLDGPLRSSNSDPKSCTASTNITTEPTRLQLSSKADITWNPALTTLSDVYVCNYMYLNSSLYLVTT